MKRGKQKPCFQPFVLQRISWKAFIKQQLQIVFSLIILMFVIAALISLITWKIQPTALVIGLLVLLIWVPFGLVAQVIQFRRSSWAVEVTEQGLSVMDCNGTSQSILFAQVLRINRQIRTGGKQGPRWTESYFIETAQLKLLLDLTFYTNYGNLVFIFIEMIEQRNKMILQGFKNKVVQNIALDEIDRYQKRNPISYFDPEKCTWQIRRQRFPVGEIAKIELQYQSDQFVPGIMMTFKNGQKKTIIINTGIPLYYELLFFISIKFSIPFSDSVRSSRMLI